jgi:hypothetical protein
MADSAIPLTPELDKQRVARDTGHSEAVGQFLEWLMNERRFVLAKWGDNSLLYPAYDGIEALLADYFKIDLDKIEAERRAILAYIRGE